MFLLIVILFGDYIKINAELEVIAVTQYDLIWSNGISYWYKPQLLSNGYTFVSFLYTIQDNEPNEISYVITSYPENALIEPISYSLIWHNNEDSIYLHKPMPPINYICFGDFISTTLNISSWNGYKCIHRNYVNELSPNSSSFDAIDDTQIYKTNVENINDRNNITYPFTYYQMFQNSSYSFIANCFNCSISMEYIKQFAPILKFDVNNIGYPMNAQKYVDDSNQDITDEFNQNLQLNTITNPTYYRVITCTDSNTIKILFWWFYGYQADCFANIGSHPGDWERIVVQIDINRNEIIDILIHQHSGHYTVTSSQLYFFENSQHPIIYIGQIAHGCYYNENTFGGGCGYFYDYRNPKDINDWLFTHNNLIDLATSDELWIVNDIDICCSNPLRFDIDEICQENGCDDIGCNYLVCDDTAELLFVSWNCISDEIHWYHIGFIYVISVKVLCCMYAFIRYKRVELCFCSICCNGKMRVSISCIVCVVLLIFVIIDANQVNETDN